jgi:cobalt-zinc-cadmium efflux system membrane fusion protein
MKTTTLLLLLLLAVSCGPGEAPGDNHTEETPSKEAHEEGVVTLSPKMLARVKITTTVVEERVLAPELETTGQVDFEQDLLAHVTPRIPGRVHEVFATLGDQVDKGQVLLVIDSIELGQVKATFLQARAQEDLARQNYERERGLYADRISSEQEMLAAKAAHLEAQARLQNAEETLHLYGIRNSEIVALMHAGTRASLLPVRAPLGGRVVEKHVTVGELVTPERMLFSIADLSRVWIWIDVYERDLKRVHLEDDVHIEVDASPGQAFGGKVSYLSAHVDADTRTVRARVDVENPAGQLRPGMFARVRISDPHQLSEGEQPQSLVVPEDCVQRDGNEFIVFVALGQNRFERREVTLGRKGQGFIEVVSGLHNGEAVVSEGVFLLKSEVSKENLGGGHSH